MTLVATRPLVGQRRFDEKLREAMSLSNCKTWQSRENVRSRDRARQRARNRIAAQYRNEVNAVKATVSRNDVTWSGAQMRAVRIVCDRHRAEFEGYFIMELAQERDYVQLRKVRA